MTEEEIVEYLRYLRSKDVAEMVFPGTAPRIVPDDEDDDPVLHTAVVGRADALCTLNKHFFVPQVVRYGKERGILICTDVELLRTLRTA